MGSSLTEKIGLPSLVPLRLEPFRVFFAGHKKTCREMLTTIFVALQHRSIVRENPRQTFIAFNEIIGCPLSRAEIDKLSSGESILRPEEFSGDSLIDRLCQLYPLPGYEGMDISSLQIDLERRVEKFIHSKEEPYNSDAE